jgi:hypothetical protein
MLAIMIAPEYILSKACADLVAAFMARNEMRNLALEDGVKWGLGYCFFANMSGFVLAAKGQAEANDLSSAKHRQGLVKRSASLRQTEVPEVEVQTQTSAFESKTEDAT